MTTIYKAREALDQATAIIKQLIMDDKLVTDVQRDYGEFLDFWEETYALDRLLDRYDRDTEVTKRLLIIEAQEEAGCYYD